MKRIAKKRNEQRCASQDPDISLTENEKFVKKLDIQIDIIKKIIDPGEILPLLKMNGKSELK